MSTQEERLQTVESDLQHFKTETVKAYGDMAVDLTLVKGIALKSMERLTVIETKLDNHTERFDGLEITLSEHSRALYDHTTVLKEHTTRFDRLESTLSEHTTLLAQILARLPEKP
jgi:hypothetical protein